MGRVLLNGINNIFYISRATRKILFHDFMSIVDPHFCIVVFFKMIHKIKIFVC